MRHHAKFRADRSNVAETWLFNFSRWRRPPFWIFKLLDLFEGPICINMPNFVLIA